MEHEIPYEKHHHGAIEDIERALDQNRLVAATIDADDLWYHEMILKVRELLNMDSPTAYLEWKEKWIETFSESRQKEAQALIMTIEEEIFQETLLDSLEIKEVFRRLSGEEFVTEDHILLVSKIDRSDPDNPMVHVIDSGTSDGKGKCIPT